MVEIEGMTDDEKRTLLDELRRKLEPAVSCARYNPTPEVLSIADEQLRKLEASAGKVPRDIFLKSMGIDDPSAVRAKAGSIAYCINQLIEKRPDLARFNIRIGIAESGDKFTFKRSGAPEPPEEE